MCVHVFSLARLFVTPWTVVHQAPLSMGYSRQVWVAVFFSRGLPNPGIEPWSPALQADSLLFELQGRLVIKAKAIDISVLLKAFM